MVGKCGLKYFLFVLFLFSFPLTGFMQQRDYLEIKARIFVEDGILEGTTLDIEINEKEKQQFKISRNAEFPYRLKFNSEYKLTFSKPGLYSRIILISTQVPKTILDINSIFPPIEFQINLFKEITGVDKSFSLRPYARIFYDKTIDDFSHELFVLDNLFAIQLDQALAKEKEINKEQKTLNKLELQELQEMQKEFDQLVKEADNFFNQNNYTGALSKYQDAVRLFPDRPYPQDRIREIQNLLDALKLAEQKKEEQQQLFKKTIQQADKKFQEKQYNDALDAYRQAIQYKPDDNHAQQRIIEIGQIQERIQTENTFTEIMSRAEGFFSNKEYEQAIATFREAATIQPNDPRPGARIEEINRILQQLGQQAAAEQLYKKAIQDGDRLAAQQKYADAIVQYRKALEVKAGDAIAKEKIQNAETAIQQAQNQQAYNTAIATADKAFKAKDYPLAEAEYRKALELKPQGKYPQDQIAQIGNILAADAAEKLKNQQYATLVRAGDSLLNVKNYQESRSSFVRAKSLFPQQKYPDQMIARIDKEQAELAAQDALRQQAEASYRQAISRADQAFQEKQYEVARMAYSEALKAKPGETYPTGKIEEISRVLQEEKEKIYREAIASADRLFDQKQYPQAIEEYRKALLIKDGDSYASRRADEAARLQEALVAENARLKKLDEDYNRLLGQAADAARRNDLSKEKEKLSEALLLKPSETHPLKRIAEIDDLLEKQRIAAENERFYADNMKAGQQAFSGGNYQEAKNSFEKALQYKPNNPVALQRINEIDQIMAQRAEAERVAKMEEQARLEAEKASREKYNQAIALADAGFGQKRYTEARGHYVTAMSTLPEEQYPKNKIREIDTILEEIQRQAEIAKQHAARDSINKIRIQDYQLLIKQAEQLAMARKYEDAISRYYEALKINTDNKADIDSRINGLRDQMRIAEKQQEDYRTAIRKADNFFNSGKYAEARPLYTDAGNAMPNEEYPKIQLQKIQEINDRKNAEYTAFIEKAEGFFSREEWQSAKNNYSDALAIMPGDQYASSRIRLADQKIDEALAADAEKLRKQKEFNDLISQANQLLAEGKLRDAQNLFQLAKQLNPNDTYPDQKIREIARTIETVRNDSVRLAQAQDEDNRYRQIIALSDQSFRDKLYNEAIKGYENALQIKPGETYPKKQIELIKQLTQETVPALVKTEKPIVAAPEPKPEPLQPRTEYTETAPVANMKALSSTEINKLYEETITRADGLFEHKDYAVSRFFYSKASDLKPAEMYPKQRIEEIGRLIDAGLSAEVRSAYDNAIKQADDAFSKNNYTVAKFYYYKALEIKSWEGYPKDRIYEIQALTKTLLSEQEEKNYNEAVTQADEAYYTKNYSVSRFHYNKALQIKPDEHYPKIKLDDIEKLLEQEKRDRSRMEYMEQVKLGDQAFEQGNYGVARFYYSKALSMQSNDQHSKDQLKRIEEIMAKQK